MLNTLYFMYYPSVVCISLKYSIFGEFSNIYLLSAENRVDVTKFDL